MQSLKSNLFNLYSGKINSIKILSNFIFLEAFYQNSTKFEFEMHQIL
jgi:hypothetical protein